MQSKRNQTQAKNIHYNRKILPCHFASRQPRRDQSISRCNQNAIITRSIARRCCITSNFARRCSYPDKKDKFTARLNFWRGIFVTLPAKIFAALLHFSRGVAALIAPRCSKSLDFNDIFPCKINILAPLRGKSSPLRGKSSGKNKDPLRGKSSPLRGKSSVNFRSAQRAI